MLENEREKLGLCHKNIQISHVVRKSSCHSKRSEDKLDEQIYDSEFEEYLNSLRRKFNSI